MCWVAGNVEWSSVMQESYGDLRVLKNLGTCMYIYRYAQVLRNWRLAEKGIANSLCNHCTLTPSFIPEDRGHPLIVVAQHNRW